MARVVPPALGAGEFNWDLCATNAWELLTLFAQHVRLDTHRKYATFLAFSRLPAELQIRVLQFCSNATLFQLMQTSATLRHEASKLFWSDPDSWYLVDGSWLLRGGFAGEVHYATDFLCRVQQIEIDFDDIRNLMAPDDKEKDGQRFCKGQKEKICDFWRLVQRRFPQVRRVVISQHIATDAKRLLFDNVGRVLQDCPVDGYVSVMSCAHGNTVRATRYRARFVNKGLEVTELKWVRRSIVIPTKVWRGPVGEYAQTKYEFARYMRMYLAQDVLLLEAIERSFGKQGLGFHCPRISCNRYFTNVREWIVHAIETGDYMQAKVPEEYEAEFARWEEMVESGIKQMVYRAKERIHERYKGASSKEKEEIEQAFLDQLRRDAEYAQSQAAEESDIWVEFQALIEGSDLDRLRRIGRWRG
jgi:hypothetical protein